MHKFLFVIFFILILSCSNSKNKDNSNNKVEIILSNKDNMEINYICMGIIIILGIYLLYKKTK